MNVLREFRKIGERLNKVLAKSGWGRGSKARALETVAVVHRFEQLHEWTLAPHRWKFVASEKVHDLAEECHLFHTARHEPTDFAHDFLDGAASLRATRLRYGTKRAMHVASLHDGDERGRLPTRELMVADRFGGALFFLHVANGEARIIHPARPFFLEKFFHVIGHAMEFLGAHDEVHMRQSGKKRIAPGLGHAAEKTEDDLRPALRDLAEHPHFPESLLVGHVANAACIQQHHIRLDLVRGAFIAARQERVRDLFGIALVHLATVGFDEKFWHRASGIVTQTGRPGHNELNERRDFSDRDHWWQRPLSDGRRGGRRRAPRSDAIWGSFRRNHWRSHARTAGVLLAAAWARTSPAPTRAEPSREHLRAPLAESALDHLRDGRRKPAGTIRAAGRAAAFAIFRSNEST